MSVSVATPPCGFPGNCRMWMLNVVLVRIWWWLVSSSNHLILMYWSIDFLQCDQSDCDDVCGLCLITVVKKAAAPVRRSGTKRRSGKSSILDQSRFRWSDVCTPCFCYYQMLLRWIIKPVRRSGSAVCVCKCVQLSLWGLVSVSNHQREDAHFLSFEG